MHRTNDRTRQARTAGYALVALIAAVLFPANATADIETLLSAGIPVKCGTFHQLDRQAAGAKIAAVYRPSGMQHSALSAGEHFRVHYNTEMVDVVDTADLSGNGIPDYVDSALVYLEYAYDLIVDGLGFEPPLPDGTLGGGPELDVYLRNLSGIYGQTFTVTSMRVGNAAPAYLEIDNDFSESIYASQGLDALKVTTAHEFFHAVQFRLYCDLDLNWWQEHSAVWMEDYVWDEVNDYFAYLRYFFTYRSTDGTGAVIWSARDMPLDSRNGIFEYGAAVWAHYLVNRHGPGIIRTIWDHLAELGSNRIGDFDAVVPGGLDDALGEFAAWNYFTKDRGNGLDFYPDSPSFPAMMDIDATATESPAQDSLTTPRLTNRYAELLFGGQWEADDRLAVTFTPLDGGTFEHTLVLYNSPFDYRLVRLSDSSAEIDLDGVWDRAVLITACASTSGGPYDYAFEAAYAESGETPPLAFALTGTYPNPFNSATTIAFTVPDGGGRVTITALNILGQAVDTVYRGQLDAGEKHLVWQPPAGLAGGPYFLTVDGPWGTRTVKTLFLK